MGRIHVLDDSVINKIAAGEVVERPASVVKELVENALDAGAHRIDVALELGGTRSLVVTDDGGGMAAEDARLAVVRHATSKIRYADDLFNISSMGFRGEALASIAAVSRFTLSTRLKDSDAGTRLIVNGGEAQAAQAWSGATGTSIAVENLFFNLPVRAKFLKAPATEYGHCLELLQAFALAHPKVAFSLTHNGKEQFRVPAVDLEGEAALRSRAAAVLGKETADALQYVESHSRYGDVTGLVSPPGFEKVTSKHIVTFVNGRWVKDKTVRYGILRGYHSHLLKGRFPVAIIQLAMDPSLVDVNVHPAKTELRFQYPTEVQNLLALAIRDRLRDADWAQAPSLAASASPSALSGSMPAARVTTVSHTGSSLRGASARPVHDEGDDGFGHGASARAPAGASRIVRGAPSGLFGHAVARPQPATVMPFVGPGAFDDLGSMDAIEDGRPTRIAWTEMDYLGSFDRCYLFFDAGERLLVVDQHAFHERILFERLSRDESLLGKSQPLLVPEAVELSPTEVQELRARKHLLLKRGFDFELEGDTTVAVTAVPAILAGRNIADVIADLAKEIVLDEGTLANADLSRHLLATAACHAAVRAGEELGDGELKQLLAEAHTVDFFHNCPHGRRVLKWWTRGDVARWFDR